jgi:hypothetical protein
MIILTAKRIAKRGREEGVRKRERGRKADKGKKKKALFMSALLRKAGCSPPQVCSRRRYF